MKKVTKSPLVMDVLNIQGVQRSLERLADLLGKIQKALGEYLERERSSFPRSDIHSVSPLDVRAHGNETQKTVSFSLI